MEVVHPLVGAAVPSLETLRERADARAGESLDIAARLCQHRVAEQRQLWARADKLDAAPWTGGSTRLRTHPEALLPGDLVRALLVCEPERIATTLADELQAEAYAEVVASLSSWSGPARNAPPRLDGWQLRMDPAWARRWALADVRHGRSPVTVQELLASLGLVGLESLAPFSKRFAAGQATRREVAERFVQRSPRELGQRLHEAVPPAYIDRHGGLAALDAALAQGPGVLVVGAPRRGRSELVRAWVRRVTAHGVRPDWQGRPVVLDPHVGGGAAVPASAWVGLTARAHDGVDADADGEDARLRWLAAHADGLGPAGSLRVVVVVETAVLPRWLQAVPALAGLARVEVPAVDPPSLAAIWLGHTLARPGLGLDHVLAALEGVGLPEALRIDPWELEQLVRPPALRACFLADAACEVVSAGAGGRVIPLARDRSLRARRIEPGLLEALGGAAGLERLEALEGRLRLADG
jgi:hypothetical protein